MDVVLEANREAALIVDCDHRVRTHEMRVVFEEKIQPYEVFSDEQYGLTVRAAFCPESAVESAGWIVAEDF